MLQSLHVKNLALIDEIEVEFAEGLNILTGETGAGKSIILGSVNLALGGRYTKDLIRQGENYALVELVFTVTEKSRLKALEKLCIYPEDGLLILSRKLMDGRSVSRINGETVTIAVLKEVAAILIDIHGQHEHQSLLYKKNHLGFVDAFAWDYLADIKKQAASAYQEYRTCKKTLDEADMDESSRAKELDFLKFEVSEIEDAMLKEGEDEELETTFKRMENGRKIAESTAASYAYTSGEAGSASECLSRAIRELAPVSNLDETAGNLWIITRRKKTNTESNIRLLDVPRKIIEKYRGMTRDNKVFPMPSNTTCNKKLKAIAKLCGIKVHLTYHVARHSAATTVLLSNGVPIETVSRLLGHTNIKTTQIYAKITAQKISQDMETLSHKLEDMEKNICNAIQ